METQQDRVSAKREEILAAACEVFREEGYESTSMDRVAERAEASKRTVYNHFGSKDALFEEVVGRFFDAAAAAKRIPWDPARPVDDQLADFARAKAAFADDEASMALMRVVMGVAIQRPEFVQRFLAKYTGDDDGLVQWLRQANDAGALSIPDAELAAELFWAMAGGALFWPAVIGVGPDATRRELLITELVETFLARYRA